MIDFTSSIESLPKDTLLSDPGIAIEYLPTTSPYLSLSERIANTPRVKVQQFCARAVSAIQTALVTKPDSNYYTPDQLALAQANLTRLQQLLADDCSQGRIDIGNYMSPFVPSRASTELSAQLIVEREIAMRYGTDVANDSLAAQIDQLNLAIVQNPQIDTNNPQIRIVLELLESQNQKAASIVQAVSSAQMKRLSDAMTARRSDLLNIIGLQFADPRNYYSVTMPNRDFILSLLSDEIVRRVNGGYPLLTHEGVGVGIGDINSLSISNIESHEGGNRYIGMIGDILSGGLTTLILKNLGRQEREFKTDREIGSMMRGSDETGSFVRLNHASVRAFVEVMNILRFEEIELYSTKDIINLENPVLLELIGKILGLGKPYILKQGEKFGAGVTFAGESFLYALAHVHLAGNPQTFYEALRPFMARMLDTADKRATQLKDEVKTRIGQESPANMALLMASRAVNTLVECLDRNEELIGENHELRQLVDFMTEGGLADLGPLEQLSRIIHLSKHEQSLIRSILRARDTNSQVLRMITGTIKSDHIKQSNGSK